ncbi:MAG: oxidoreductase [Candidatus Portnoybacteria bacterium CG10_big_fil_rev_8_21_14_0_10_44_7]|uniref:Oxidoreductase n=1 Tax=Candidatus Portnoybacteria bacterium CG10_big_fil_rev_8_21_14_0_10_44_7 TaxID=1974816 RepID=A0A2M8KJ01_9BACT|nr:MAG: oxidoreductase [Candidatus Portnoybacteria bacterium CG10_big_fil_rev_8_21_14_0_10_44_7]
MDNLYKSHPAKLVKIKIEAPGIKRFWFEPQTVLGREILKKCWPGQIIQLWLPGFGEAPFAPCQRPDGELLELCICQAGHITTKLHALKRGAKVGLRGPFGHGWPVHPESKILNYESRWKNQALKKNLLLIVGGLGLVPTRTFIEDIHDLWPQGKIQIFYGARRPDEMLFRQEFKRWQKNLGIDLQLTIDQKCAGWRGCVGVVTELFNYATCVKDANAFLVGPPVMYKFVLERLKKQCFEDQDIFLSLERRMHCAVGICQHCAVGPYYVCQDGPVFRYDEIKQISNAI